MSGFQRFMNTINEQCTLTPGQSHIKASSLSRSGLEIYHQNTQGLKWKSDEILDFFHPVFPHVMCITERNLNQYKTVQFYIDNYTLGCTLLYAFLRERCSVHFCS
jgi:hypothetical protein